MHKTTVYINPFYLISPKTQSKPYSLYAACVIFDELSVYLLELPPEGIVGSEVGSAEGLVRDVGSGIFTTIFSLPSFLCVLLFIYLLSVLLSWSSKCFFS